MTNLNKLIEQRQGEFYDYIKYGDDTNTTVERAKLKRMYNEHITKAYRQALLDLREGLPESKDIEKHTIEMLKSGLTNKKNRRKARIKDRVWNKALETVRAQIEGLLSKIE